MITEFKFPDVGEGITEGDVVEILVREGDYVKADQPIMKVETDKAIVDIPSPKDGIILKVNVKAHETIKVGQVLVTIGDKTDKLNPLAEIKAKLEIRPVERKSVSVIGELEEAKDVMPSHVEVNDKIVEKRVLALPAIRKLAKELNVDLTKVQGTGKEGNITEKDVRDFKEGKTTSVLEEKTNEVKIQKKYDFYGYIEHVPVKGVRRAVAKKMVESASNAVHVTHMDEADVTLLFKIREKEKVKAGKQGIHLTFMPFIMKAVIECLKKHPFLNSSMGEDEIILKKYYNIGFAVDTEDGLMVPVIKGADKKSMIAIAKEEMELADKARKREIDLGELKGGTFTITNVGSIGGLFATPIINYPEAAILALGKIQDKAIVENGKIIVKKMLTFSLAFDHRILDGAEAARFAKDLISYLEDPDVLLVEME